MCGIAGIVHFDGEPADEVVLRRMTDVIAHRGPDGEGWWTEGAVGLGHRRLAILDLSEAAAQPMVSGDERYVLVYNGELYNFRELRGELEGKGAVFRSHSDTEVVLEAFAHWGTACLNRFNGMFAFAMWDRREKTLTLARDRYGVKPLYYATFGSVLLFGSEIKAMLSHPRFEAELDREALLEYFTFQNFFTDRTLHKNVRMLPAGHFLQLNLAVASPPPATLVSYWDFDFREPEKPLSEQEYLEELDYLLRQAVERQLVSDVDVQSYLSGGMDSGAITALASEHLPWMRTFTVGFDLSSASGLELAFDEREKAERMSYLFKTEHYEMVLKSGDMERCMKDFAWHLEEPRVGQSYPNWYASKLAGSFGKVVLSGTGGDELFGGYPWRYYRGVNNIDFEHYVDKYYRYWNRLIPNVVIHKVFSPIRDEVKDVWTRDIFRDVFRDRSALHGKPEEYVNKSLYMEAKTFLHGLFVVEDKLAMAHGLETRVPFMDNDLVDFAQTLPVRMKLGNLGEVVRLNENEPGPKTHKYFQKTQDGKLLLRKVMSRYVPKEIAEGVKQGFSAPDAGWFRGDSINYVKDLLYSSQARLYDYLDRDATIALVDEHLQGCENRRLLIWSLLYFEEWLGAFG